LSPADGSQNTARQKVPAPPQEAVGYVLAGGRSSRMGTDKALIELDGKPLIAHALGILRDAGLNPSIAGARSSLEKFAPVVPDLFPDQGPLRGICSALASTSARWAVFLTVDLPLLPPNLIRYLLGHAQSSEAAVTVASVNGFAQTFPAVIDRVILPALEQELAAGRLGCFSAFQRAADRLNRPSAVFSVEAALASGQLTGPCGDSPDRWFMNLNAPEDLHRAEANSGRR
jgi:molybdopterin-guanine dinucleotide biosynthesis protein A